MLYQFLLLFLLSSTLFAEISKEELLGKIDPQNYPDFVKFESGGRTYWLRKEVAQKLKEMIYEAKKDGIDLKIVSAFRSYSTQKAIWERKIKKFSNGKGKKQAVKEALKYSAMPGTSRHHWGTDIDLVSIDPAFYEKPYGKRVFLWLCSNATRFGFFMPYSSERKNKNGYKDEYWHWSYYPLAREFLSKYTNIVSYGDIDDFTGCELAVEFEIFPNFVLNIGEYPQNTEGEN